MFDAVLVEPPRQLFGKRGIFVANDAEPVPSPLCIYEGLKLAIIDRLQFSAIRNDQDRPVRSASVRNRVRDLRADADSHGSLAQITIQLRALVSMSHMLYEVDPGIGQSREFVAVQVLPVQPGKEQDIPPMGLPARFAGPMADRPKLIDLARNGYIGRLAVQRDSSSEARQLRDMSEVVGVLEVPSRQANVLAVEPY